MPSQRPLAANPARQLFTPASSESPPQSTSKSVRKRIRLLSPLEKTHDGTPIHPRQAKRKPKTTILDDEEDIYDSALPRSKLGHHGGWKTRNAREAAKNNTDLDQLLLEPKSLRVLKELETRASNGDSSSDTPDDAEAHDLLPAPPQNDHSNPPQRRLGKDSPLSSAKWRTRRHSRYTASALSHSYNTDMSSPQKSDDTTHETSSPVKRQRRTTMELTLKRLRIADEDDHEDDSDGMPPPPQAKRARLDNSALSLKEMDREVSRESSPRLRRTAIIVKVMQASQATQKPRSVSPEDIPPASSSQANIPAPPTQAAQASPTGSISSNETGAHVSHSSTSPQEIATTQLEEPQTSQKLEITGSEPKERDHILQASSPRPNSLPTGDVQTPSPSCPQTKSGRPLLNGDRARPSTPPASSERPESAGTTPRSIMRVGSQYSSTDPRGRKRSLQAADFSPSPQVKKRVRFRKYLPKRDKPVPD